MKTTYGSAIVPHVPTSKNDTKDEDGEDLLDNPSATLTPAKRSIGESESGSIKDMSLLITTLLHLGYIQILVGNKPMHLFSYHPELITTAYTQLMLMNLLISWW